MPDLRSTYPAGQSQTTAPPAQGVDAGAYISALMQREAEWNAERYKAARERELYEARQRAAAAAQPRVAYRTAPPPQSSPADHGNGSIFGENLAAEGTGKNVQLVPLTMNYSSQNQGWTVDRRAAPLAASSAIQPGAIPPVGAQGGALASAADFERFKRNSQAGLHITAGGDYLPY